MKKSEFNHDAKQWDRHHAFHAINGIFTQFETGELIIHERRPDPYERKLYAQYNVGVWGTTDDGCPQLYFDKACTDPVKKAWLNHGGMHYIAVDHEEKVAVRLGDWGSLRTRQQQLPKHLEAPVVWMRPGQRPVPTHKFTISKPDMGVRKELCPKLQDVRAAVKAAWRINQSGPSPAKLHYWSSRNAIASKPSWADTPVEDLVASMCGSPETMKAVADHGFTHPRAITEYEYLHVK